MKMSHYLFSLWHPLELGTFLISFGPFSKCPCFLVRKASLTYFTLLCYWLIVCGNKMSANRRAVNLSALASFQYTTTVDYSFWLMYNIPHLSQQVGPCGSACGAYLIDVQVEDITPTTGWLRSSLPLLIKAKTPRDKSLLLYAARPPQSAQSAILNWNMLTWFVLKSVSILFSFRYRNISYFILGT